MPLLPDVDDPKAFYSVLRSPGQWTAAVEEISQRHSLGGTFAQSEDGSTVVFLSQQHCIKLLPPFPGFLASLEREVAALGVVANQLPVSTPEVLATETLEDWHYFVSTRLPGRAIDTVWDGLSPDTSVRLAAELGHAISVMHALDAGPVAALTEPWGSFRPSQRQRCLERERDKGLSAARLSELEAYLARLDAIGEPETRSALLHTEIGPGHVLVDGGRITGLIDFGDAMVGDPEYDLSPVGMFVTRGDRRAFRSFCEAYGLTVDELRDPVRTARLLRHALLHRYGTLAWYLEYLDPPSGSLDQLAEFWFELE